MKPLDRRTLVAAFACSFLLGGSSAPQDAAPPPGLFYPRTIVLVRHAEKAAGQDRDPSLSEQGVERAKALARHLSAAGVTHLFATELKRTRETLAPLSFAAGLSIQVVSAADSGALKSGLASLPRGSVAVVAGHSNTIPGLAMALARWTAGGGRLALEEGDYDRLYVVTQWSETGASLLELRY